MPLFSGVSEGFRRGLLPVEETVSGDHRPIGLDRREMTVGIAVLLVATLHPSSASAASPDTPVSNTERGAGGGRPVGPGIAGRVRTATGQAMRDVVVMIEKLDPPPVPIPELANSTDRDGRFFWPVPRGRYRLRFVRDGRPIAERVVDVTGAEVARDIDVVVDGTGR